MKQVQKFSTKNGQLELEKNSNKIKEQIANFDTGNEKISTIIDGIINIQDYVNAKYKILWILKEPWDSTDGDEPEGGDWDNTEALNNKKSGKEFGSDKRTYFPIIHTSYGIFNDFCIWNDMDDADKSNEVFNALKSIAVINVKKTPGLKTTSPNILKEGYNQFRDILLNQIEVYNPDIVIGGSTLNLFFDDLNIDQSKLLKNNSIQYYQTDNRIYISAYHPSQWSVTPQEYCDDIILTVKKLVE